MQIKRYRPTTSGRRGASVLRRVENPGVQTPERSLLRSKNSIAGRNNTGRITVRHQGSGHKQKYRVINFTNPIEDVQAKVIGIQYDPNRTADVALLSYKNGVKAYTLAVKDLKVGDVIETTRARQLDINPGNRMPLKFIPAGMLICNIELFPGRKSTVVRSAGSSAVVMSIDGDRITIKMPSSEIRAFSGDCLATIGQVGNTEHNLVRLGKAGRMRNLGVRPRVTGKSMNPVDHPHGGGEGHTSIGLKAPKTPWGKPALGVKTRSPHKASDSVIIRRRKKNR